MPQTVLIVEDEKRIAHWVEEYFKQAGFQTLSAADGAVGLALAQTKNPDLIILDIMLPSMDGIEICRTLRQDTDVPIIMLTARGKEADRIRGLNLGADDYIVKPFSPGELIARAWAVLRRSGSKIKKEDNISIDNIRLDAISHTCIVDEKDVKLSKIQFAILQTFMSNIGRVFSREQLLNSAFGGNSSNYERTIDVHIRRLRKKIERDPPNPEHILTVFGVGYKFV